MKKMLTFAALAVLAVGVLTATVNQAQAARCYYHYVLDNDGDLWRVTNCYY